jgi:hypothetical protein
MRPADTSADAWRVQIGLLRKMSPEARFRLSAELSDFVRAACEAGVRAQYPDASEREVFWRIAERILGRDLCRKVYGNLPTMQ